MCETSTRHANADQEEYWNSEPGRRWIEFQEVLDAMFAPVTEELFKRARPAAGERVLEVGCGTGATTRELAGRVGPDGRVVGIDISRQLLDHAQQRAVNGGAARIEYRVADAQTHRFDGDPFDLAVSRFGVMFFDDPVAAFRNLGAALGDGGRLAFVSWAALDRNPFFKVPRDAAVARLGQPAPTPPGAPGPLAFAEVDYVLDILSRAGLGDCRAEVETVHLLYPAGVEEAGLFTANMGPAARLVRELGGTPEDIAEIGRVVAESFRPYAAENRVRVPATLNFFQAVKPPA